MCPPDCKQNCPLPRRAPAQATAVYVHVPFCHTKCRYCDFYSLPHGTRRVRRYLDAVSGEVELRAERLARPAGSVYVGGGTPTCLAPAELGELLTRLGPWVGEGTEFTVEANPGTVTDAVADTLADAGVNRVVVGAQSFADDELARLGRAHTGADARQAVRTLRRAGIDNIGIDLMYGLAGQSVASWRRTLEASLQLDPAHLSAYALSYEPGTPLARDLDAGRIRPMDDDLQRRCYDAAVEAARQAGLHQYELSNFARPRRRCRQNLTYWRNRPYVGVGPAAAGYLDGVRYVNAADLDAWAAALDRGEPPPASAERLVGRAALAEALMLALRMTDGADRAELRQRYGEDPVEAFGEAFARHVRAGALEVTAGRIRLARSALFVSDTVLADVVAAGCADGPG